MDNKKITTIALGRLGLSFSLLAASKGYQVMGYEINEERKTQIINKTVNTPEPHVMELLKTTHNLKVANTLREAIEFSDLIFVLVATPSFSSGEYDHSQILSFINEAELLNITNKTVCIVSTTMPKFCQSLQDRLRGLGINIVYNASFIAQGSIINDIANSDIVLVGGNPPQEFYEFYDNIMNKAPNFRKMSPTAAEIAKISLNCALTMKIAFANNVGDIAMKSGVGEDIDNILSAIGNDSRIGNKYLKYGFGYGGPCFPRDEKALGIHAKNIGLSDNLQLEIDKANERHAEFLKEHFIKENPDKSVPFIFSHITYKSNSDILTESQQLRLALELLEEGYTVYIPKDQLSLDLPKEIRLFEERGFLKSGYDGMVSEVFTGNRGSYKEILQGYQIN